MKHHVLNYRLTREAVDHANFDIVEHTWWILTAQLCAYLTHEGVEHDDATDFVREASYTKRVRMEESDGSGSLTVVETDATDPVWDELTLTLSVGD